MYEVRGVKVMGFFFEEEEHKPTNNSKSLDVAYKQGCKVCTLRDGKHLTTKNMPASGSKVPTVYIVGEAPGRKENELGEQFVGKSGGFIRDKVKKVFGGEFYKSNIRWNNIVACQPKDNRTPTEFEIACCRKRLEDDIVETEPLLVAGFGNVPLQYFLKNTGILAWRGRIVPTQINGFSFWYSANLHPSFIQRQGTNGEDTLDRTYMHTFEMDLKNTKDFLIDYKEPEVISSGYTDNITIIKGTTEREYKKLVRLLQSMYESDYITIDIETAGEPNGLSPYNKNARILTVSVSNDDLNVAFPIHFKGTWLFDRDIPKKIIHELAKLFMKVKIKIAHNSKFEISWFANVMSPDILQDGSWYDTMGLAVTLDERAGGKEGGGGKGKKGVLNLGNQTLIHFGFDVKKLSEGKINIFNLESSDLKDVLVYNGMDSKYEHLLYKKMRKELPPDLEWTFKHVSRVGRTLSFTEHNGLVLDVKATNDFGKSLEKTADRLLKSIRKMEEIKTFEDQNKTDFLPSSTDHIVKVFRDIMKLEPVKKTAKGGFSTDKLAMAVYAEQGVKIAKKIVDRREALKLKSTYIDATLEAVYPDGLIHPNFKHLFVSTGRLSAESPPIQTFPKRKNADIRNVIVAPPDHCILAADFAQIEARIIAVAARDMFFINMIWDGYDIHMDWAKRLAKTLKLTLDKDELKKYRSLVKNQWVFPLIYGSSQKSAEKGLNAKEGQLSRDFKEFWEKHYKIKEWQDEQLEFYNANGYVKTLMGRRRHMPMSKNEFYNSPIQSAASDIVTDAMNRLSKLSFRLKKPQYQPIWNIHDDLGFYIPNETVEEDMLFIAEQMCVLPFEFIDVPMGIEVSVGEKWGDLEEIRKFSTLDFNPDFIKKRVTQ